MKIDYKYIMKNKDELSLESDSVYNNVIKPLFKFNGSRKIQYFPTNEIEEYLLQGDLPRARHGDLLFFMATDLVKSVKYFSMDIVRGGGITMEAEGYGSRRINISAVHLAEEELGRSRHQNSWYADQFNSVISSIEEKLGIFDITDIFSNGYFDWITKNSVKNHNNIKEIKNKMQFILWKKYVVSESMTNAHFKRCIKVNFRSFKSECVEHLYNIPGLFGRKYFDDYVSKIWGSDTDYFNSEISKIKLKLLNETSYAVKFTRSIELQNIYFLENVRFKDNSEKPRFFRWCVENDVFNKIRFTHNENSYFSKKSFINHLEELYT